MQSAADACGLNLSAPCSLGAAATDGASEVGPTRIQKRTTSLDRGRPSSAVPHGNTAISGTNGVSDVGPFGRLKRTSSIDRGRPSSAVPHGAAVGASGTNGVSEVGLTRMQKQTSSIDRGRPSSATPHGTSSMPGVARMPLKGALASNGLTDSIPNEICYVSGVSARLRSGSGSRGGEQLDSAQRQPSDNATGPSRWAPSGDTRGARLGWAERGGSASGERVARPSSTIRAGHVRLRTCTEATQSRSAAQAWR